MATSLNPEHEQDTTPSAADPLDAITAKWEAHDATHGGAGGDDEEGEDAHDEQDEQETQDEGVPPARTATEDDEHPAANTESSRDGDEEEIAEDSESEGEDGDDDEGEDHPADEAESDDPGADAAGDDGEGTDEGDDATTRARLAEHGADLTLEDVPAEYRPIVEKKIRSMDAAFTRAMQEHTAFRQERAQLHAEARYRAENPELVILELLEAGGPDLFERVNQRLDALAPEAEGNDQAKDALAKDIEAQRTKAREAVDADLDAYQHRLDRAAELETYARERAKALGLRYGETLERAIAAEIMLKPEGDRPEGLTTEEVDAVIAAYAKDYGHVVRQRQRDASREQVRTRTQGKKAPAPTVRAPSAPSPGSAPPKRTRVDHNNEDARLAALEESAKRILAKRGKHK